MLISGLFNIVWAMGWFFGLVWVCVGVLWLVPMVIGFFEVITAARMLGGAPQPSAKTVSVLGLVSGALNCSPVSLGCELVSVIMLANPAVTSFIEGRDSSQLS